MKKILSSLFLFFFVSSLFASPINRIVFFGDSLSDNGNLYSVTFDIVPKSPPYFKGRFSNGPTWAEHVGKYYYDKYYIDHANYAYGGATAIFHWLHAKLFAPALLSVEVDQYLLGNLFSNKSNTLFSIWIGGNDYAYGLDNPNPEVATSKVVDGIVSSINTLFNKGGRNFLVIGVPDISKTPFARAANREKELANLSQLHNLKLVLAIKRLQEEHPEAKFIYLDMFDRINDLVAHPDKYNKKYNIHLTNTHDTCWEGGYLLKHFLSKQELSKTLTQTIKMSGSKLSDENVTMLTDYILSNPTLAQAYAIDKSYEQGMTPCANPNEYLFWDYIHPTALVHQIIGLLAERTLDAAFSENS